MGNSASSETPAAEPKAVARTILWGSWDKPVANAYATKQSKSAVPSPEGTGGKFAADAAPGSQVQLQAGAGLNPPVADNNQAAKSAGVAKGVKSSKGGKAWTLNQSCKQPHKVAAAKKVVAGKISKPIIKRKAQSAAQAAVPAARQAAASTAKAAVPAVRQAAATASRAVKTTAKVAASSASKAAEQAQAALTHITQVAQEGVETEQDPAAVVVDAAQATAGALQSKAHQAVASANASASQAKQGAVKKAGAAWTAGTSSKTAAQIQKRKQVIINKLGVKKPSGIRKSAGAKKNSSIVGKSNGVTKNSAGFNKGKVAVAKAGKVSGRMSEAAKHAAAAAAQSVQKAVQDSGVLETAAAEQVGQAVSKVAAVAQEAAHTVQGAMSTAVGLVGEVPVEGQAPISATADQISKGAKVAALASPATGNAGKTPKASAPNSPKTNAVNSLKAKAANSPKANDANSPKAAAVSSPAEAKSAGKKSKGGRKPRGKASAKRMVAEIDAQEADVEGLGRGKRQRKQVKAFQPSM